MPRADYYREQALRLISLARATRHVDLAAELVAQARLYLSLARVREGPGGDLTPLLNEFNARQMRHIRELSDEDQAGPLPEHLARLLARLEGRRSPPARPSGTDGGGSGRDPTIAKS
jgi:hypothetical protein